MRGWSPRDSKSLTKLSLLPAPCVAHTGLAVSLALWRLAASLLYGISATDCVTFIGVPLLLLLVAFVATFLPARRASRVDPMDALRFE